MANLGGKNKNEHGDLKGGSVSAEKAKDKALAKEKQEQKEAHLAFYGAGYSGEDDTKGAGSSHQAHAERKDYIGHAEFHGSGLGRVGRRFALTDVNLARVVKDGTSSVNLQDYFRDLGVTDAKRFFAQTKEKDSNRFLTDENTLTNEAVKMDNYEYFLDNSGAIKSNLAKTLLAKMDLDRDIKGTLSDLLEADGKWNNADPDVIFGELKNRLRNTGVIHQEEYDVILKTFAHIDRIEKKHADYIKVRQKTAVDILDNFDKQINAIIGEVENSDSETQSRDFALLSKFFKEEDKLPLMGMHEPEADDNIGDLITKRIAFHKTSDENGTIDPSKTYPAYLDDMSALLEKNSSLLLKSPTELKALIQNFEQQKEGYVSEHNKNLGFATEIMDRFNFRSKFYPVATLARWADEEYLLANHVNPATKEAITLKDIDSDMDLAIMDVLANRADVALTEDLISSIKSDLKRVISQNKEAIAPIYDPEKDTSDKQRQYRPFESQHYNEDAHNILRDGLYLSLFKNGVGVVPNENGVMKSTYSDFFDVKKENEVVCSAFQENVREFRPNIDEVTDLANIVNAINKTASATIDDDSFDSLIDSPLFENNCLGYTRDDFKAIKSYGKDVARVAEQMKETDIYGTPEDKELRVSIQEMVYIESANREISKLYKNRMTNGFYFLQNNKALRNLETCMESARNPTTSVETVASIGKGCFQKMKDEYDQLAKEANSALSNPQSGWAGMTFLGAMLLINSPLASASADRIRRLEAEVASRSNEDTSYVLNSADKLQKSARFMNLEAESVGIGSYIVKETFKDKLISEAEGEHTVREIISSSGNKLPDDMRIIDKSELLAVFAEAGRADSKALLRAKKELLEDSELLKKLEISLTGKKIDLFATEDEKNQIKNIYDSIDSYESVLSAESNKSLPNTLSIIELKDKIDAEKVKLISLRESVLSREDIDNTPPDILEISKNIKSLTNNIDDNEKIITSEELRKNRLSQSLPFTLSDKSLNLSEVKLDPNDSFEVKMQKSEKRNAIIIALGSYRDTLNKKLNRFDNSISQAELKAISQQVERIDRVIPILHREALADSSNLGDAIRSDILDKYHFEISDDIVESIQRNGLNDENIASIMEQAKVLRAEEKLSAHKENGLFRGLVGTQSAVNMLNPSYGKISYEKGANNISSFVKKFSHGGSDGLGKLLKDTNNYYATSSVSMDGNAIVSGGKGRIGMFLKELEDAEETQDYKKMIQLSQQLEQLNVTGYITNHDKEEILSRLNRQGNNLAVGNDAHAKAIMKQGTQSTKYKR